MYCKSVFTQPHNFHINIYNNNLSKKIGREDKNGRRQTTFGFEIDKKFSFNKIYRNFFFH